MNKDTNLLKKEIWEELCLMANTLLYSKTKIDKPILIVDEFTEYLWTWFENQTGGLYRGEMEQKYKDYLSEKGTND
jgi:hypothetical protein